MEVKPDAANCRSCEAPIMWVRTRSGKKMPLDADAHPDGEFYLLVAEDGAWEGHHVKGYPGKLPDDVDRHRSHFSTCPNADQHRRAR